MKLQWQVSEGKDLAGPCIGEDIAGGIVSVIPQRCRVFGHAGNPVRDRVIGGKPCGGDTVHRVDIREAVSHAIIGETRIAPGAIGGGKTVGGAVGEGGTAGRRHIVVHRREVHSVAVGVGQAGDSRAPNQE